MIEPRLTETERTLVATRWLMLTAVLVITHLIPAEQVSLAAVYGLVAAGAAYNLAYSALLQRRYLPPAVTELTVLVEMLFCGAAIGATGGAGSPLTPLLIWPVIGAAFRLGLGEALASATLGSLVVAYFGLFASGEAGSAHLLSTILASVYLFLGAILIHLLFSKAYGVARHGLARERQAAEEATAKLMAVRAQAQAIAEISSILSSTLNYQRVLETILTEFNKLLGFDIGLVLLFTEDQGTLRVAADHGLTPPERQIRLNPAAGAIAQVIQQGTPLMLVNPGKDEELQRFGSMADVKSALCVPLHAGFEMYGAVVVASKNKDAFSPTHLDLLLAFCNQAVLAMQNARLYDSLRKERDRVVESDEEARRRVARDLHDGPVQLVAAMAMKAEIIKRLAGVDQARMAEELDALAEMSHRASRDLRTILFELRPVMLESHGLVATLKEFVQKMHDTQNAPLRLDAGGFSRRLPPKTESTIFAIVQEAVNNALKHAEAHNIWIRLSERDRMLTVQVEDDGQGFDVASVEGSYGQRGSLGLLNMRERAEMVDGLLTIRSLPNFGTTVTLRVPLTDALLPNEGANGGSAR